MGTKAGPDKTTTQNSVLPAYITQAQQDLANSANTVTDNALGQTPLYNTMGLTPNQLFANDLAFQAAKGTFTSPQLSAYGVNEFSPMGGITGPYQAAMAGAPQAKAQQADFVNATAAQLKPGDISPFMNPYIDTALNPVLDRLRQQQGEVQSRIGADAAASHMFGGSREAVQRMLADRNYRDTLGTTAGNMLNTGWNTAAGLAQSNTANQQQTNMANAQMENAINSLNAQLGTGVSQSNAGNSLQASMANAQGQNQANNQFQNLQFQGGQNQAQNYLQGVQLQSQQNAQNLQNQLASIGMLNNLGLQQQATGQQALNVPYQNLQALTQAISALQGGGTQTTTQNTFENPLGNILGAGLGILGMPGTSILGGLFGGKKQA